MKPATRDSGDGTTEYGLLSEGTRREAAGGATAPTQQAEQALQYELFTTGGSSAALAAAALSALTTVA